MAPPIQMMIYHEQNKKCDERIMGLIRQLNGGDHCTENSISFVRDMMDVTEECGERNKQLRELGHTYARLLDRHEPGLSDRIKSGDHNASDTELHGAQSTICHYNYYTELTLKRSLSWAGWMKALISGL